MSSMKKLWIARSLEYRRSLALFLLSLFSILWVETDKLWLTCSTHIPVKDSIKCTELEKMSFLMSNSSLLAFNDLLLPFKKLTKEYFRKLSNFMKLVCVSSTTISPPSRTWGSADFTVTICWSLRCPPSSKRTWISPTSRKKSIQNCGSDWSPIKISNPYSRYLMASGFKSTPMIRAFLPKKSCHINNEPRSRMPISTKVMFFNKFSQKFIIHTKIICMFIEK